MGFYNKVELGSEDDEYFLEKLFSNSEPENCFLAIMKISNEKMLDLKVKLEKGDLNLKEIKKYLEIIDQMKNTKKTTTSEWRDPFFDLLNDGGSNKDIIGQRLDQIDVFIKLNSLHQLVEILEEILKLNNIQGDFSYLEQFKIAVRY